jgi:hypothetical protein
MNADILPPGSLVYPRTHTPPPLQQATAARAALAGFALFLGLCAAWMLIPDLLKPVTIAFPRDRDAAAAIKPYQERALHAAEIGLIRGGLWAQAAFTDAASIWQAQQGDKGAAARLSQARATMETGLAFAPINGGGWLFLALLPSLSASAENRVATLLEMSYFTAPSAIELAPLRIERAAASNAISDKAIQEFVKSDIRLILSYRPKLKSAIVNAYRNAWPQNQPLFEELVADIDPDLAQSLQPDQPN